MNRNIFGKHRNRRGSATVLLCMIFVAFAVAVAASVDVCRQMAFRSECKVTGKLWTKAVLSEYDRHLLKDYGIMAFYSDGADVDKRIEAFRKYSSVGDPDPAIGSADTDLSGYRLSDPEIFRKQLKTGLKSGFKDTGNDKRKKRAYGTEDTEGNDENEENRYISNPVVLDTLPSEGIRNTIDIQGFSKTFTSDEGATELLNKASEKAGELRFITAYLGNHVTCPEGPETYFRNEWEYILFGRPDDAENFKRTKAELFAIRNAFDISHIFSDPAKTEAVTAVAELITPGPAGAVTQVVIAEIWAAAEAEKDVKRLLAGGKVPLVKTAEDWQTDLDSILKSNELKEKLDDEQGKALKENIDELSGLYSMGETDPDSGGGFDYEEYLLLMMSILNDNVRTLRIMDIVQIDMKYRYYDDFCMDEYHTGIKLTIRSGGKVYETEESYK